MWDNYEIRSHKRGWAIVHLRTGQTIEVCRTRRQAEEMLVRYNSTAS